MDTRTALLDSAEFACRSKGYDAFSYADLSAAVGIRKASIHYHFPSKSDLALAVIDRYHGNFFEKLKSIATSELTAAQQLSAYIDIYRSALSGGESVCLCVAFSAGRASLSNEVLKRLNAFHSGSVEWLTDVFKTANLDGSIATVGLPRSEASAVLAQMEGAQLMARAACDVRLFDAATKTLSNRLA